MIDLSLATTFFGKGANSNFVAEPWPFVTA